jgi:hypothetical protein
MKTLSRNTGLSARPRSSRITIDRGNKPGKYTWKRDGKTPIFTKVEDEARGRAG